MEERTGEKEKLMNLHEKAKHYESETHCWHKLATAILSGNVRWTEWESCRAFNPNRPDYYTRFALLDGRTLVRHSRYVDPEQAGGTRVVGEDGLYHNLSRVYRDIDIAEIKRKYFDGVKANG